MYKKILTPIMGKYGKDLADHTLDLINDRTVELISLYVVDGSVPFLTPKAIKKAMIEELKRKAKIFLDEFEDLLDLSNHPNITFKRLVLEGKPAEVIVDLADKECIDVVVMGTGKGVVDKHLLGSVSEEVVHFAPCTIHLVRTVDGGTCNL
jgi:nucleotide-binding universal stress UspA family protein